MKRPGVEITEKQVMVMVSHPGSSYSGKLFLGQGVRDKKELVWNSVRTLAEAIALLDREKLGR